MKNMKTGIEENIKNMKTWIGRICMKLWYIRNCMKKWMYEGMYMKTGIVWRICMKLWWIWNMSCMKNMCKVKRIVWRICMKNRNVYVIYEEYEDMNCMKKFEVMMNMKTWIVWRICMKLWWRYEDDELYEEYVWRICMQLWRIWRQELYEEYVCIKLWWIWRICYDEKTGMKVCRIWRHELCEEYVWSYEEYEDRNCMKNMYEVMIEYEDRNCMKNMYEVMMNMKTWIVWRICMKLWWICRHMKTGSYEEYYVWSYDEYEEIWIVWRICMKLWWIWRHELYEEYVWSYDEYEDMKLYEECVWSYDVYEELYEEYVWSCMKWICMKNMYEVMMYMKRGIVRRIRIWRHELYEEYEDMNCLKNCML